MKKKQESEIQEERIQTFQDQLLVKKRTNKTDSLSSTIKEILEDLLEVKKKNIQLISSNKDLQTSFKNKLKKKEKELMVKYQELRTVQKKIDEILEDLITKKENTCFRLMIFNSKKQKKYKKIIKKSALFDNKFYLKTYRDARCANETPLDHFVKIGLKKGYRPNESFDAEWYGEFYEDVKEDGSFPFIHYAIYGKKESRFPNYKEYLLFEESINLLKLVFDEESYLKINQDIEKLLEEKIYNGAFDHFKQVGYREVFDGKRRLGNEFPFFTLASYQKVNEDLHKIDLQKYFFEYGYKEYIEGVRLLGGSYPFELTVGLISDAHISNPKIKEAIKDANSSIESMGQSLFYEEFCK